MALQAVARAPADGYTLLFVAQVGQEFSGREADRLAVMQQRVVRVQFVINLKTAKTLCLTFPITLLGRADEVIE